MGMRGVAAALGGAAAVAAVAALGLLMLGGAASGPSTLITNTGKAPVYYYIPAQDAQSPATKQQQMQYFYLPKSVLPQATAHIEAPTVKEMRSVASPQIAEPEAAQLDIPEFNYLQGSILNETGNGTADGGIPAGHVRSCAITSLRIQAHGVFGQWDRCGYLFRGDPDKKIYRGVGGYISAPPNDEDCTPEKMLTAKCKREWTRTLARNDHESLLQCLRKVRGLSQTCTTYSKCGPSASFNLALGEQGVCDAADGGYFKEPSVQRMCGICGMFHAMAGFVSTRDFNDDDDDDEEGGGCFSVDSIVDVEGKGQTALRDVIVGQKVKVNGGDYKRVYFIHQHSDQLPTLKLQYGGGEVELTASHYMPVYSDTCGAKFCDQAPQVPAGLLRVGDRFYTQDGVRTVEHIEKGRSDVRYILVEGDMIAIGGALASVRTSALGWLETLPFKFLDAMFPGLLQWRPVASVVEGVLESPARKFAARLNSLVAVRKANLHMPALSVAATSA